MPYFVLVICRDYCSGSHRLADTQLWDVKDVVVEYSIYSNHYVLICYSVGLTNDMLAYLKHYLWILLLPWWDRLNTEWLLIICTVDSKLRRPRFLNRPKWQWERISGALWMSAILFSPSYDHMHGTSSFYQMSLFNILFSDDTLIKGYLNPEKYTI